MTRTARFASLFAACCMFFLLSSIAAGQSTPSATPADDSRITSQVLAKLQNYDRDMARRIQVSTKDGVVTLSGYAFSPAAMAQATRLARSVPGVTKVENQLAVTQ